METRTINQTVVFKASPHEVYEALMDSDKHSEFTGTDAEISREVGGGFSAYGGYCSGTNIELVPDKKIIQRWRAASWPEGHTSTITLLFNEIEEGTELTFTHEDVPAYDFEGISEGWYLNYWERIKEMLDKGK